MSGMIGCQDESRGGKASRRSATRCYSLNQVLELLKLRIIKLRKLRRPVLRT